MSGTNPLGRYRTALSDRFAPDQLPVVTTGMALVTVLLWTVLLRGWLPTPPMPGPVTAPGVPEAMGTGNGVLGVVAYLVLWGVMMAAMMYPAMIPLARQYADELDDEETVDVAGYLATLFVTYSLVWTATGLVPLLVEALLDVSALASAYGPLLVGALGLFIAAYQQSDFKQTALGNCCRGADVDDPTVLSAVSHGLEHARDCVASTWPFFALMVLAGSMNAAVMLGLTLVVAAERLPTCRGEFTDAIGVVAGIAGLLVVLVPGVLP